MKEVITTLGNFVRLSDYFYLALREMVVLGIIGHSLFTLQGRQGAMFLWAVCP